MSAFKGQLMERGVRPSGQGGAKKLYRIDQSLWRTLGQGTNVLLHLRIWSLDTNCQITISLLEGCLGDYGPDEEGFPVTIDDGTSQATSKSFTGTGNVTGHRLQTVGELMADVLVQVEVEDTMSSNLVAADFELWATVIDK